MAKTITMRVDNDVYEVFKKAASGARRNISNFMEYAALTYVTQEMYVSDEEMDGILRDKTLCAGLKKGLEDVKKGRYSIAK